MMYSVSVRVEPAKVSGFPHTDIGIVVREGDEETHYYTRLNYILNDSPQARAMLLQQFKARQGITE